MPLLALLRALRLRRARARAEGAAGPTPLYPSESRYPSETLYPSDGA